MIAPDFDRRAGAYDSRAHVQRDAAKWLAEWLPSQRVDPALELGAGTGFFTRHALRVAPQLTATDISPLMVESGRESLPQVRWIVADASHPPRERDAYQGIFSCSLIQWLPDPAAAFRRWFEISANGALFLGGWFVRGTMANFFEVCPEAAPFPWRSRQEWESLLADAGWRVEQTETKTFDVPHASSSEMLRNVHDIGAVIPRRIGPGRLRSALRENDLASRHAKGILTPFVFMRVKAFRP